MSELTVSTFALYKQSIQEQLAGSSFSNDQKQFIQNQIAEIAQQILNIELDPNNYAATVQQDAFLKGQLKAYQYLLDCSLESEAQLLALAAAQQATS